MAGLPKMKAYHYDMEGKYIKTFDSSADVFREYYDGKRGLLFNERGIKFLPDNTVVTKERIGRIGVRREVKIANDPLCLDRNDVYPIDYFNLLGEKIASFSSIRVASILTHSHPTVIATALKARFHGSDNILIKKKMSNVLPEVEIAGGIYRPDGTEVVQDDFETEFYEFLESKGYAFGGGINPFEQEIKEKEAEIIRQTIDKHKESIWEKFGSLQTPILGTLTLSEE